MTNSNHTKLARPRSNATVTQEDVVALGPPNVGLMQTILGPVWRVNVLLEVKTPGSAGVDGRFPSLVRFVGATPIVVGPAKATVAFGSRVFISSKQLLVQLVFSRSVAPFDTTPNSTSRPTSSPLHT